ncbi:hypothetical protein [Roseomonas rosulenta]|uniref:hypothetical protein n=1 Tax=Roseomonas rosulenta TaxID=2748667 RepID=UPI0018E059F2|nr:hypothetical protein [Roseomonas rosulenta]
MNAAPGGAVRRARLLLDLCHIAHDQDAIATAAELARLLERDLLGIYVEDEAVQHLASLPFARELRLPSGAWAALDPAQLDQEFRSAAERLRAMLRQQASRFDVRSEFQTVRADPARYVAGISGGADVVVLAVPREASARAVGSFAAAWHAAIESPATTLLLPSRLARRRGPVAAVLGAGAEQRARAAASLAAATGENVVALVQDAEAADGSLGEAGRSAGRAEHRLSVRRLGEPSVEALLRALSGVGERLLMLDRRFVSDVEWQAAMKLSEALGVPLLFD